MAYSLIEQHSIDLDIFLIDSDKIIHLASGGGLIPERLTYSDAYNSQILQGTSQDKTELEIEINPNLRELLNLTEDELSTYLTSFISMAKRGFYSFDKTKLGNFEDQTFHLVAKPKSQIKPFVIYEKYTIFEDIISANQVFPIEFKVFNISEYM